MNWKTLLKLWKIKKVASPGRLFVSGLRRELNSAWKERNGTTKRSHMSVMRFAAASLVVVMFCGFAGTGAYAYTSPEVTEGTILYSIKQKMEQVAETTKITPEAKAKFNLKKIARREAEMKVMEKRKQNLEKVEAQIEKIENKLEDIDHQLEKIEVKDKTLKPKIKELLQKKIERQKALLENKQIKWEEKGVILKKMIK